MVPEKNILPLGSSRVLVIHVLVNRFVSYKRWENRWNSSLVKSNTYIFSTSLIVLGQCCLYYFTSNYSRMGRSQSLWVWQLQDPDVQHLEWISLAVAAGCHFPFSAFFSRCDVIVLCIIPTLFIFTPFSCNNRELTHCGMFLMCERNYTQRSCFSCLHWFTFFDLSGFSLDSDGLRRIRFIMQGNPTPARDQIQPSSLFFK